MDMTASSITLYDSLARAGVTDEMEMFFAEVMRYVAVCVPQSLRDSTPPAFLWHVRLSIVSQLGAAAHCALFLVCADRGLRSVALKNSPARADHFYTSAWTFTAATDVPQQHQSLDCAVFVAAFVERVCRGLTVRC